MVSPTLTSLAIFIPEIKYPTFPAPISLFWILLEFQNPDLFCVVSLTGIYELDPVTFPYSPIKDPEIDFNSPVGIENRIEDHGLQGLIRISLGARDLFHYRFQDLVNSYTFFSTG